MFQLHCDSHIHCHNLRTCYPLKKVLSRCIVHKRVDLWLLNHISPRTHSKLLLFVLETLRNVSSLLPRSCSNRCPVPIRQMAYKFRIPPGEDGDAAEVQSRPPVCQVCAEVCLSNELAGDRLYAAGEMSKLKVEHWSQNATTALLSPLSRNSTIHFSLNYKSANHPRLSVLLRA